MDKKRRKRKTAKRTRILQRNAGIVTGVSVVLIYVAFSLFYTWKFYPGTTINGVLCSNMAVEKAKDVISTQVREYTLTIKERDDKTEQIKGSDINLEIYFDGGLERLKEKQNGFLWPIGIFTNHDYEIGTMLQYDEDLLESFYNYLECFNEENTIEPQAAHISEYENGGYHVAEAVPGNVVKKDEFYEILKEKIMSLDEEVSIEKEGAYKEAAEVDAEVLNSTVEAMNQLLKANITYEFDSDKEVVDADRIHEWITVDENYNVTLDETKVKEFVDYIGKTYNTFGQVRSLKTSYGKTIEISGGDYGWWLDRTSEVTELAAAIKEGMQGVKEPVYFQTASQYGKDDVGDTYVEINLTAQHLFFYKDGALVVESDFVSGNLMKNYGTPVGTYPIQYKQRDATLVGEDYETPVSYWMPFNGNIGMHDAPWRSSFGKDIYLRSGSHGCINLPPAVAQKIYEGISRGVGVYVYELPGTENYTVTSDTETTPQTDTTTQDGNTQNGTTQDGTTQNSAPGSTTQNNSTQN
ncbi:L,D-transpeptidase family protein [Konateibacter massiliensis]|uniref:L,D-transpeptidase family protein n=1 Tax=Konateibacter massiliensis TaxID=2002841 RepID=UPI000C1490A0|nr:L,D-transpeptidase family protein [Konateibacter massiliensis]